MKDIKEMALEIRNFALSLQERAKVLFEAAEILDRTYSEERKDLAPQPYRTAIDLVLDVFKFFPPEREVFVAEIRKALLGKKEPEQIYPAIHRLKKIGEIERTGPSRYRIIKKDRDQNTKDPQPN